MKRALIPAATPGAKSQPKGGPVSYKEWSHPADAGNNPYENADGLCLDLTKIYRKIDDKKPYKNRENDLAGPSVLSVTADMKWARVIFWEQGFTLEGHVKVLKAGEYCPAAHGFGGGSGGGGSCSDGSASGRKVWLEEGAKIYSAPWKQDAEPFAVLKKKMMALETLKPKTPPDPAAIPQTRFIIEYENGDAQVILSGYVDIPNGELKDVDPATPYPGGGFGGCSTSYDAWPPKWY